MDFQNNFITHHFNYIIIFKLYLVVNLFFASLVDKDKTSDYRQVFNRNTVYSTSGLSVDLRQTGQIGPDLENAMGSRRVRFRQA